MVSIFPDRRLRRNGIFIHDHEIKVDRAFLQKMIALRNKTFHGEGKDLQEYIQAGPELLYLCEMILEAVRKGM